jgi:nucleotide-binding universal stress UspA family protein
MKLLIGYDGSVCARAAVQDLVLAGLPAAVDATILTVADMLIKVPYEEYLPPAGAADARPPARLVATARALAADAMRQAQEASAEGVALVTSLFPNWDVRAEVVPDSPYWALIKRAEQCQADLIVVGSHGRSAIGRAFFGSVSQNVLSHAACSVRVARTRERGPDAAPPRVALAIDGSRCSNMAVDAVLGRAWPDGTEVRVLTAVDPQLSMAIAYHFAYEAGGAAAHHHADVLSAARDTAESVANRLRHAGLAASAHVELADPKRFIVDQAAQWNADCIVLGARGHSRLERFMIGSVSAAVAARAGCTVEVIRP